MLEDRIEQLDAICLLVPSDSPLMASASELERRVWDARGYNEAGSLADYDVYATQSRTFAVFHDDGSCLGVSRVFHGQPLSPPFLALPFYDSERRVTMETSCESGEMEELAIAAIAPCVPHATASVGMWRLAYRDAIERSVRAWGIVMEPRRVSAMNRAYGFCFEQLGPETYYQGGNCAAHVLDLELVTHHMRQVKPQMHEWFVLERLSR